MSIDLTKIDFLVLRSGFEERLFDEIDTINDKLMDCEFRKVSFIKCIGANNYLNKKQKNINCVKEIYNFIDYGIGFKVDNIMSVMGIINLIKSLNHCAFFDFTSIYKMKLNEISNKKVLIIEFDTESG